LAVERGFGIDAPPVCPWQGNLNRLVSLWDIVKQFDVFAFAVIFQSLLSVEGQCEAIRTSSGGGVLVPAVLRDQAYEVIGTIRSFCEHHGFADARDEINLAVLKLGSDVDASTLRGKLERVKDSVLTASQNHKFLRVESERSAYIDDPRLLGDVVADTFPNAVPDIIEAGNCLAVELHTAAVFHLMRVSEYGLRSLAKAAGAELKDKGEHQPIEYAEQNKIIDAIKKKLSEAHPFPHGPKRSEQLVFYSEAAERFLYLKELRNEVSHPRKTYNSGEALGVLERVRGFMCLLARGLKEHDENPS
jgi:hypothetical protein